MPVEWSQSDARIVSEEPETASPPDPAASWIVPLPGAPGATELLDPVRLWRRTAVPRHPPGASDWVDGFGSPLLTVERYGNAGRRWRFYGRFDPAWNDLPHGALALWMRALLFDPGDPGLNHSGADVRLADPLQYLPSDARSPRANMTLTRVPDRSIDLHGPLWMLAAILFGLERALSFRRRPVAAAVPPPAALGRFPMNPRHLQRLADRWRWQLGARDGLFALGAAGVVAALTVSWTNASLWLATVTFVTTLATKLAFSRFWTLDSARVVRHLDRTYPDLEESSALWLRPPASLTLLERLQLKRIDTAIHWVISDDPPPGGPPRGFLHAAAWCGLGGVLLWGAMGVWTLAHGAHSRGVAATVPARRTTAPAASLPRRARLAAHRRQRVDGRAARVHRTGCAPGRRSQRGSRGGVRRDVDAWARPARARGASRFRRGKRQRRPAVGACRGGWPRPDRPAHRDGRRVVSSGRRAAQRYGVEPRPRFTRSRSSRTSRRRYVFSSLRRDARSSSPPRRRRA